GYSSLSYLRRFPVDQLKLDRSFVAGIATDADDRAIAASVIGLGHALGINVVAEGVESVDQFEWLSQLGCDLAQGYSWLAPVNVEELDRWPGLPAAPPSPDGAVPSPAGDVRVLLADDRDSTRAVLRSALDIEARFAVVGDADSAERAVRLAGECRPDLILLDVAMPGTSGVDALPALRRAAPGATIVLLTAQDPDPRRPRNPPRGVRGPTGLAAARRSSERSGTICSAPSPRKASTRRSVSGSAARPESISRIRSRPVTGKRWERGTARLSRRTTTNWAVGRSSQSRRTDRPENSTVRSLPQARSQAACTSRYHRAARVAATRCGGPERPPEARRARGSGAARRLRPLEPERQRRAGAHAALGVEEHLARQGSAVDDRVTPVVEG